MLMYCPSQARITLLIWYIQHRFPVSAFTSLYSFEICYSISLSSFLILLEIKRIQLITRSGHMTLNHTVRKNLAKSRIYLISFLFHFYFFLLRVRMFDTAWYLGHTCFCILFKPFLNVLFELFFPNKINDWLCYDTKNHAPVNALEWC